MKTYFEVVVKDGECVDGRLRRLAPSCRVRCGHKHRTVEAAERCREKLMNWSRDRKSCSALWYNAVVVELGMDGNYAPDVDDVTCLLCHGDAPGPGRLCAACDAEVLADR